MSRVFCSGCAIHSHPTECHLAVPTTSCQPGHYLEPYCQSKRSLVWKGCRPDGGLYTSVLGPNQDYLLLHVENSLRNIETGREFLCRIFCYSGVDEIHTCIIAVVSSPTPDFPSNGSKADVSVFGDVPLPCLLLTALVVCLIQARIL